MRATLSILWAAALASLLGAGALSSSAAECFVTAFARDAGWYRHDGFHDPANVNYFAGYQASTQSELRNWFVFDLPPMPQAIAAAELRLYTFNIHTTNATETFELRHVSSAVATLTNGGSALVTIFDDLGDGPLFGSAALSTNQSYSYVSIPLTSNAVSLLNASLGQAFALGGRVATLPSTPPFPTNDTQLFGFSYPSSNLVQLTLWLAPTSPPTLLREPPPIAFAASGSSFTLEVAACGASPLGFQWFFNDQPMPGRSDPILSILNVTSNRAGTYYAVASNPFGATTSSVTRLFVDILPATVSVPPTNAVAAVGESFEFYSAVIGSPPPVVQWHFNGAAIPGATNPVLSLASVQSSNTGVYTVTASNFLGFHSRNAILNVQPLLLSGPADLALDSGSSGFLAVTARTTSRATFQWRRSGTNIPASNAPFLPFISATSFNAGAYDVVVANAAGVRTSRVAQVSVLDAGPRLSPPTVRNAMLGSTVMLEVEVEGSRPIHLQWHVGATPIALANHAQHFIPNAGPADEGVYFIVASNAFGVTTSGPVTLTLSSQPPAIGINPVLEAVFEGDALSLGASVEAGPPAALQWRRDGTDLAFATNAVLLLTNLTTADNGTYELAATNSLGGATSSIQVVAVPRLGADRWTWHHPLPHGNDLRHVAFANGRYVAGGNGGLLVSSNRTHWTFVDATRGEIRAIAAGNGRFVVLAGDQEGAPLLFLSDNGTSWRASTVIGLTNVTALAFMDGQFHTFGSAGGLLVHAVSAMGDNWTVSPVRGLRSSPDFAAAGNGRIVVASGSRVAVSTDHTNFTETVLPDETVTRLRFAGGRFARVTSQGTVWQSEDGLRWTPVLTGAAHSHHGVAHGQARTVLVGARGAIVVSADGNLWDEGASGTGLDLNDILFDGEEFVAVGNNGVLLTSGNGLDWTDHSQRVTGDLFSLLHTNGLFVAVGRAGEIVSSADGVDWTRRDSGTTHDLYDLAWAEGRFVAVGAHGTICTSSNGLEWSSQAAPVTADLLRVSHINGRFVVVGRAGTILSSSNAIDWTAAEPLPSSVLPDLTGIALGHGIWVTVGGHTNPGPASMIFASTNGVNWVLIPNPDFGAVLRGIAFGAGHFMAVGDNGRIAFSTNGVSWLAVSSPFQPKNWNDVVYCAGRFIAVGDDGQIESRLLPTSTPSRHRTITGDVHGIAFADGRLFAVGRGGAIVESERILPVLGSPRLQDGWIHFTIQGGMEPLYLVETSDDLQQWQVVGGYLNDGAQAGYAWPVSSSRQYYRLRRPE